MSSLTDIFDRSRQFLIKLRPKMSQTKETHITRQRRSVVGSQPPTYAVRVIRQTAIKPVDVPEIRTSDKMVAQARARAMQGAKSEFAKLMDELNATSQRD